MDYKNINFPFAVRFCKEGWASDQVTANKKKKEKCVNRSTNNNKNWEEKVFKLNLLPSKEIQTIVTNT